MRIIGVMTVGGIPCSLDIETEPGQDVIELFDDDGEEAGVLTFNTAEEANAAEALLCAEPWGNA